MENLLKINIMKHYYEKEYEDEDRPLYKYKLWLMIKVINDLSGKEYNYGIQEDE